MYSITRLDPTDTFDEMKSIFKGSRNSIVHSDMQNSGKVSKVWLIEGIMFRQVIELPDMVAYGVGKVASPEFNREPVNLNPWTDGNCKKIFHKELYIQGNVPYVYCLSSLGDDPFLVDTSPQF